MSTDICPAIHMSIYFTRKRYMSHRLLTVVDTSDQPDNTSIDIFIYARSYAAAIFRPSILKLCAQCPQQSRIVWDAKNVPTYGVSKVQVWLFLEYYQTNTNRETVIRLVIRLPDQWFDYFKRVAWNSNFEVKIYMELSSSMVKGKSTFRFVIMKSAACSNLFLQIDY